MQNLVVTRVQTPEELAEAYTIREAVFIQEQGVKPEEEWDETDKTASHYLALHMGQPVGVARVKLLLSPPTYDPPATIIAKVQRLAVLPKHRGKGVGHAIMEQIIRDALNEGTEHFLLEAQIDAIAFYEDFGFEAFGDIYDDCRIQHRKMKLFVEQDVRQMA